MKKALLFIAVFTAFLFTNQSLNAQDITGVAWDDNNGNGLYDDGPGCDLAMITVDLLTMAGAPLAPPVTTMTAADGTYTLTPPANATYIVSFSGFLPNAPNTTVFATIPGFDSDIMNPNNAAPYQTGPIVYAGVAIPNIDAGVFTGATVQGELFEDLEADGVQDATDPLMTAGVTVCLFQSPGGAPALDGMGMPIPCMPFVGTYSFTDVTPGDYYVEVQNFPASTCPSGGNFFLTEMDFFGPPPPDVANDSDFDLITNQSDAITLTSKAPTNFIEEVDAGFYSAATVAGEVWDDINGNGMQDGEQLLAGTMACLMMLDPMTGTYVVPNDVFGVPVPCLTTSPFMFNNLVPGTYVVFFEQGPVLGGTYHMGISCMPGTVPDPTTNMDVNDVCFPCTPPGVDGQTAEFVITSCGGSQNAAMDVDAAYYQATSIGDLIFHDGSNDGLNNSDPGDAPYSGDPINMVLNVECPLGSGTFQPAIDVFGNPVPPQMNAADGSYCFDDLPPGTYNIDFTLPQFWNFSTDGGTGGGPNNEGGADDSDIDGTGTTSNNINTFSGEPKLMNVDFGVWKCMTIGGTVWSDGNENGVLDNMEAGLIGILVQIEAPFPVGQVITLTDFQPGTVFGGYWEIGPGPTATTPACLPPGDYEAAITQANFDLPAGPLINWFSSAIDGPVGPPFVDNDDSGVGNASGYTTTGIFTLLCGQQPMGEPDDPDPNCDDNNNMTIDFGFYFDCQSAQGPPVFTTYFNCDDSYLDPLCDVGVLNNFCGSMPQMNNGTGPTPLCPGGCSVAGGITGVPHNTSWVSFIASQPCIDMNIYPSDCQNGTGLQWGVYEAIESPCNAGACIVCDGNCNGSGVLNVQSCNFIPGQQYFFWLDGCNGTWCDYEFEVIDGAGTFTIPPVNTDECAGCLDPNPPPLGSPYLLCTGATSGIFTVDTNLPTFPDYYDSYTGVYEWSITPPLPSGPIPDTDFNFVDIDFSSYTAGQTVTLCMDFVGTNCSNAGPHCFEILIQDTTPEDFGSFNVCEEDFDFTPDDSNAMMGYVWNGPTIPYDGNGMADSYTELNMNTPLPGCTVEQIVEVVDFPTAVNPNPIFVGLCPGDDYTVGTECGTPQTFTAPLVNTQVTFPGCSMAGAGCDSIINLNLELIQVLGDITDQCLFDPLFPEILITWTGISDISGYDINYTWLDQNGSTVDAGALTAPFLTYQTAVFGEYTLVLEVMLAPPGITPNACLFEFGPVSFDPADYIPADPVALNWPLTPCVTDTEVEYCIDPVVFDDPNAALSWLPTGGTIVSGGGGMDDCVTIAWDGNPPYQLQVTVFATCGTSMIQENIQLIPSPVAAIVPITSVCAGQETMVGFDDMGDPNPNLTYNWDFGGGVVQSMGGTDGPGPYPVIWATSGQQTVTLTVMEGACESAPAAATVEILEPLEPPVIMCAGGTTSTLTFTWNDVGADDYIVTIVNGPGVVSYTSPATTAEITGLVILDAVTISVEAVDNGACDNVFAIDHECIVQNCVLPVLMADAVADICLVAGTGTQDLSLITTSDLSGSGEFTGNGVTLAGIFDPTDASVVEGQNNITWTFTTDDMCVGSLNIPINVYSLPIADFTVTPDICQSDAAVVEFTGATLPQGFTWDTGGAIETMITGAGPHNLTFNPPVGAGPDVYTITLVTSANGCDSEPMTQDITVHKQIAAPVISCSNVTTTSVEFTWTEDPAVVVDELFTVITLPPGAIENLDLVNNTYEVTNINEGDAVDISITSISPNAFCMDQTATWTCTATACATSTVTLDGATAVCESEAPYQIGVTFSDPSVLDGSETIVWTGAGVDQTGLFDPSAASYGLNAITYTATIANCSWTGQIGITVDEQVAVPMVTCIDNGIDFVEFGWPAVPGAAEYIVTVVGQAPQTTSNLTWLVDMLSVGDMIDIEVVAVSSNSCPNSAPGLSNCTASNCDTGNVMFSEADGQVICIDNGTIDFDATVAGITYDGDEIETWSGDGINTTTGVFDPSVAGVGTHVLSFELSDVMGQCLYPMDITITVEDILTLDVECGPTGFDPVDGNFIVWTWNDDPCFTGFNVTLDGVFIGLQTGTTYQANNLLEGATHNLEVEAISGCACPNVVDDMDCIANDCPMIDITLSPTFMALCDGDQTDLFPVVPIITGSNGTGTGSWSGVGIDANGNFDPTVGPGVYTIDFNFDENGCPYSASVSIEIWENPTATAVLIDPDCFLDNTGTIEVSAAGGAGGYDILLNGNTILENDPTLATVGPTTLEVTDVNNCKFEDVLTLNPAPTQSVEVTDDADFGIMALYPETLTYGLSSTVLTADIDSVIWTMNGEEICYGIGGTDCETITLYTIINNADICATLYFNDGCVVQDCTPATIRQVTNIFYPTVFNPNGDFNPMWAIGSNAIATINEIAIFDRWGERMLYLDQDALITRYGAGDFATWDAADGTSDNRVDVWDGTFKSQDVVPGVYVFVINYSTNSNPLESETESGDLTVLR